LTKPVIFVDFYPSNRQNTIDFRYNSTGDESVEDRDEAFGSQTVFEGEQPATFDHVAEQTSTNSVKVCIFLFINTPYPVLKLLSAEFFVPHSQTRNL